MTDTLHRERGRLHYPYGQTSSDEEVLAAVLNALHHHSGVPQEHIRAEVARGRVVLSGVVCQDYEKSLAEKAASEAPGVVVVINNIALKS